MRFPEFVVLENTHVRLDPLGDFHREDLRAACNADPDIWDIYPYAMNDPHFDGYWAMAMDANRSGLCRIYAVQSQGRTVGTTSYYHYADDPENPVSIGGTYYAPDVRGTALNPAAKLLLLDHAFAAGSDRVHFHVDVRNQRSQAAVLKLGATPTRIIARDRTTWTGHVRDTAEFEINAAQWPGVRDALARRVESSSQ
jgi:N-acetyltransferase